MTKAEEMSWLWHSRLGHVNFKAMELMSKEKMAYGLPQFVPPTEICRGCLMSKQVRHPFPSKTNFSATKRLELVHGDLCGPISPPTPAGNRYFMLLVDDFTRTMWVYFLKTKDETFESFQKFKSLVEDGPDLRIKTF